MGTIRLVLLGAATFAVALYLALAGILYSSQDRLLYVGTAIPAPTHLPPGPFIPDGQGHVWALVANPSGTAKATVLFFHGNGNQAWMTEAHDADFFTSRGYRVVFAEYPGYAGRAGSPSRQLVTADAADGGTGGFAPMPAVPGGLFGFQKRSLGSPCRYHQDANASQDRGGLHGQVFMD
jgi:hypothetical protein